MDDVYSRLCQQCNTLSENLSDTKISPQDAAAYAGWILDQFGLAILGRALDVPPSVGLSESVNPATGAALVDFMSQFPPNPVRHQALLDIASVLSDLWRHSPADPPAFNQTVTALRSATAALRSSTAGADVKLEAEELFMVTVSVAADLLGVAKGTVTKWADSGKLQSQGHGKGRRILLQSMLKHRDKTRPRYTKGESEEAVLKKFARTESRNKNPD